jgi:hypothetical protein
MTTSDYINLALFVAVIAFASMDITYHRKTRALLGRAVSIIGELVLLNSARVAKGSQDPREFNEAAALSARATILIRDAL